MPPLQPAELWEQSGRAETMRDVLFHLKDRRERDYVIGPTHEEVVVDLFKRQVQSYRDMPLMVYQIQTKARDEARPRGGLMRVREFTMKDAYSFDAGWEGLDARTTRRGRRMCASSSAAACRRSRCSRTAARSGGRTARSSSSCSSRARTRCCCARAVGTRRTPRRRTTRRRNCPPRSRCRSRKSRRPGRRRSTTSRSS